jgi:hypothetical protein
MLHREARANLKQRLLVALDELIDDHPPRVVSDGLVYVAHTADDRQVMPCLASSHRPIRRGSASTIPHQGCRGSYQRREDGIE